MPTITREDGVRVVRDAELRIETRGGPTLIRPLLKTRARIVEVMAEDMRTIAAVAGSVDAADLKLAGWTAAQITLAGEDAASRAAMRSAL
jgi:hypothetical protein